MKRHTAQWVAKAEEDVDAARMLAGQKRPHRNAACFHCQQGVEKYLKALLQELGLAVPRTHDVRDLVGMLLAHDPTLARLRRGGASLTKYAVQYRYPSMRASSRQLQSALRTMERFRTELRARLGLPP